MKHTISGQTGNLRLTWPITQFYKVAVDNSYPLLDLWSTQDNNSLGVPSRILSAKRHHKCRLIFTLGGDGYETQIDPENPDIIYPQYQYEDFRVLIRGRAEKQLTSVLKLKEKNEPALRWNWDSPLLISTISTRVCIAEPINYSVQMIWEIHGQQSAVTYRDRSTEINYL
ncbi:MAG: hypothetical protein IPI10_19105 [Bacteroidetes bacterium]|nr:hypothetical protein [Bacteroidota bacterium]